MNSKKVIGNLLLILTAIFINAGTASVVGIGVEEMPQSIIKKR